jgi:hypothetical protein
MRAALGLVPPDHLLRLGRRRDDASFRLALGAVASASAGRPARWRALRGPVLDRRTDPALAG